MDIDQILKLEEQYNLYDDTIEGIHYWMYARSELCAFILPRIENPEVGKAHNHLKSKASFWGKVWGLLYNSIWNGKRKAFQAEMCIIGHERRIWENNEYECKYTKEIYEYYKDKAIILERPYNYGHLKPIGEEEKVVYLDYISLLCNFHYLFVKNLRKRKYREICNEVETHMREPLKELNQEIGIHYTMAELQAYLAKIILRNQTRIRQMEKLLDKIQPRSIMEVVGYSNTCMAANEVAKRKNIITYEMQHGIAGHTDYGYNFKTEKALPQLPSYFLTFGDYVEGNIRFPVEKEVRSVGFPYLERKVMKRREAKKEKDIKTVLFLSSGQIGEHFSQLACRLAELTETEQKCNVIYKLHPGEYVAWEQRYPRLLELEREGKIRVIDSSDSDLYQLFDEADVQVAGTPTTSICEGLAFGLVTLVYDFYDLTKISFLFEEGFAQKISDTSDIQPILDAVTGSTGKKEENWRKMWKGNAMKNIVNVIEKTSGVKGMSNY